MSISERNKYKEKFIEKMKKIKENIFTEQEMNK